MEKSKLYAIVAFITVFILLGLAGLILSNSYNHDEDGGITSASSNGSGPGAEYEKKTSSSVPGLEVNGPRTVANVVANMKPVVRWMQDIYSKHREKKSGLGGRMELELTVEWNGEIGLIKIASSTLSDPDFERAVLLPIQSCDFDPWGRSDTDTHIIYPISFG
jgi:TonB family protein